jgi:hypothetical protein
MRGEFVYCPASAGCRICDGLRAGVSAGRMFTGALCEIDMDFETALDDEDRP